MDLDCRVGGRSSAAEDRGSAAASRPPWRARGRASRSSAAPGSVSRARRHGWAVSPIVADLSTPDGPADAVAQAVAALGGLDLLVVNTGGPPGGTFRHAVRGGLGDGDRRRRSSPPCASSGPPCHTCARDRIRRS